MAGQTIPTFTVIARKKSGWNIRAAQLWIPCGHWPSEKGTKSEVQSTLTSYLNAASGFS